jgi:hypothetical protein
VTADNALNGAPPPRVGRLDSLKAVRLEMVRIYRAGRLGTVNTRDMTRFVFALQAIGKMLEASDLEIRLEVLERALASPPQSVNQNGAHRVY